MVVCNTRPYNILAEGVAPVWDGTPPAVGEAGLIIADLNEIKGRDYPAGRNTRNLVGGASPIQAERFCMGWVVLRPGGGQVPWHSQEQEEIYFILEGQGEMCLGEERREIRAGQAVYIPPNVFHQLTNSGETPMRMLYCYSPAGDVAHWRQELAGTLPRAGHEAPPLPKGAWPQRVEPAESSGRRPSPNGPKGAGGGSH